MIQSQSPFLHPVDSSGADDALAAPSPTTTRPVPGASGVLEAAHQEAVRLFFGGTAAENKIVNYQVIGWTPLFTGTTWVPRVLAKGAFTLGAATYGATGLELGAATGLFADTVTDTIADAVRYSPADDTVAFLEIDCRNCQFIQVQTDLDDATTADVFAQFGEAVATAQIVGSVTVTGGLTNTQLRATAVPVSGSVTTSGTVTEASAAGIKSAVDYVLSATATATIGATAIIPTAFSVTLGATLMRIALVPRGDVYYAIGGAASTGTAKLPSDGLVIPVTKTVADTIQVFASSVVCDLLVFVPRS